MKKIWIFGYLLVFNIVYASIFNRAEYPQIQGLISEVHTPFDSFSRLDLNQLSRQLDFLIKNKVHNILIASTLGERIALNSSERKSLLSAWMTAVLGKKLIDPALRLRVLVDVSHEKITESIKLARHAQRCGVDALVFGTDFLYKPDTLEELIASQQMIANKVPKLPIYYYHLPGQTQLKIDIENIVQSAKLMPNWVGIIYNDSDMLKLKNIRNSNKDIDILFADDEGLFGALELGLKGIAIGANNFAPSFVHEIVQIYNEKDLNGAIQALICDLANISKIMKDYNYLLASKKITEELEVVDSSCRLFVEKKTAELFGQKYQRMIENFMQHNLLRHIFPRNSVEE